MKVALIQEKRNPYAWENPKSQQLPLTKALPFFRSKSGKYVHRVRSATSYWWETEYRHTAVKLWCNMTGFIGDKGTLLEQPEVNDVICATCEGRAIGAGQTDSHMIAGRFVKFTPRA